MTPLVTLLSCRVAGDNGDGWWLRHDFVNYGPWAGFDRDGVDFDPWTVHDWALEHLHICIFDNGDGCPEVCQLPQHVLDRREEQRSTDRQLSFL